MVARVPTNWCEQTNFIMRISSKTRTRILTLAMLAAAPTLLGGCTAIRDRRGYIADPVLTTAIQPGLDNQQSVQGTLGRPTFTSQFGDPVWYYVSSVTSSQPFGQPDITTHSVMKVAFNSAGTVASVDFNGVDDIRDIDPDGDATPTLGRERGILQDIFGNIGAVGAGGATPVGGPNGS